MASAKVKGALTALLIAGLFASAFYFRANKSAPAGDFVSGRTLSVNSDFPKLVAPEGHFFCFHAGPSMRSEGFFTPLDSADKCETLRQENLPPRVHLAWAGPASEFSDQWADFRAKCTIEPRIPSAEFEDLGKLADGLPTQTCARVQEDGVYVKHTLIMEGEKQDAFFYTVTAYAPTTHQSQADELLSALLRTLRVNKRTP